VEVVVGLAGGVMAEDQFVTGVRNVAEAGQGVCDAVEAAVTALEAGRQGRLAGRPMSEIVNELINGGGRDVRLRAADAFLRFERAIQSMRVGVIRAMIDEEGLSITEASARLGISRQAGARLYHPESDRQFEPLSQIWDQWP
jgi:hypothetical protein